MLAYALAMDSWPWQAQAISKLLLAALLGAVVGIEREHHGRSAGFRTQLLVTMGSALAMIVSLRFGDVYGVGTPDSIRVDPGRVAYGVMGGIGFLGAGTIMHFGRDIRGLTTAASLWCNAAVGLACGFGMFLVAAFTTCLTLFALIVLNRLDRYIPARVSRTVVITLPKTARDNALHFRQFLKSRGIGVYDLDYEFHAADQLEMLTFHVSVSSRTVDEDTQALVASSPEAKSISIR